MTQRNVETIVGRLATQQVFRRRFLHAPANVLAELVGSGADLTHVEIAALIATNRTLWEEVASEIEPRLPRLRLENE